MIAPKNFAAEHELYHWMIECLKRDLIGRKNSPLIAQERLNTNPTCELGGGSPNLEDLLACGRSRDDSSPDRA